MYSRHLALSLTMLAAFGCAADSVAEEEQPAADEAALTGADAERAKILSESTVDWSRRFAARAAAWKAIEPRAEVGRLATPSPADASLGIDYIFLPNTGSTAKNVVIMNSGIHGVEAPAGVLFQDALLAEDCANDGTKIDRSETAILVLQAMNPYGAKYGRRFNENNVDLNRNFFDAETNRGEAFKGFSIKNQEYKDLQHLLEGGRINILDIGAAWIRHGSDKMNKALSGQYEYPEGLYFGGREVQPQAVEVQKLIASKIAPFKNVAVIDMHTGLGKEGINQIMMNPVANDAPEATKTAFAREVELLKKMFPESECKDLCEVQGVSTAGSGGEEISASFVTTGDFTQWFHERFADKRTGGTVISVTSEIGTITARKVLEGLVDENYCHFHRNDSWSCGEEQYQEDVQRLRDLFNPKSRAWQANVVKASKQMCTAIGRFSRL